MRILLVNKFFYNRDGSARCFFDTAKLLKENGHEVAFFSMRHPRNVKSRWSEYFISEIDYNKKSFLIKKIILTGKMFYNREAARKMEKLINDFKPEVAHLHNIYHQISPSIVKVLKEHNIPIVMTLHDYKLICPNYNLFSNGRILDICKNNKFHQCFFHKCVDNSWIKSLVGALEAYFNYTKYRRIDLFISPSNFLKSKFIEYGFKKKIVYIPNPVLDAEAGDNSSNGKEGEYLLYAGRLSEEKGVDILLKAIAEVKKINQDIRLLIAGEGKDRKALETLSRKLELESAVEFIGHRTKEELADIIRRARAVIAPSVWPENFPYAVIEPMFLGKTVIGSNIGGIAEIIKDSKTGYLFKAGDSGRLAAAISRMYGRDSDDIAKNGQNYIKQITNSISYYNSLMDIYRSLTIPVKFNRVRGYLKHL